MKWSGKFVQADVLGPVHEPCWIAVDAATESEAEDRLRQETPEGWILNGISTGDQSSEAAKKQPPLPTRKGRERKGRK